MLLASSVSEAFREGLIEGLLNAWPLLLVSVPLAALVAGLSIMVTRLERRKAREHRARRH